MTADTASPLLEVRGLGRHYPGVVALDDLDLSANAGEVHALVGANGAGKSTLMNLLSGTEQPSAGEMLIDGVPVRFANPAMAQRQGIAAVHQEFSLVPQLSIARNVFLGREPQRGFHTVDRDRLMEQTRALLTRFGLDLDPEAEVASLSVADQQIVEIARALSLDARILILDEPTAVLALAEQDALFGIVRRLRNDGILVLYVSHHLNEVLAIADRLTILRDGRKIATRKADGMTVDQIAELMIGRSAERTKPVDDVRPDEATEAVVVDYSAGGIKSRITLRAGEITGLAGLVGAGRTTFAKALAGHGSATASVEMSVELTGAAGAEHRSAARRPSMDGIVYLTEDRKHDGVFASLDIISNATASVLPSLGIGPFRRRRRERAVSSAMLERLQLVASSLDTSIVKLSGGNQQKVLIARALLSEPRILVCDEPTRGVDIGAKAEIHTVLRDLAKTGVTVLVISSEIEELQALAHRIVVMHERRFVDEMSASEADETRILVAASGGAEKVKDHDHE